MRYPIIITEIPHRGAPKTWTLYDAAHLRVNVESAQCRSDFTGDSLYDYLDWLRSDLSQLIVEESPE